MTGWVGMAAGGASVIAHGIHYAVIAGGLVGLCALLVPQLVESHRRHLEVPSVPRDEHEARVLLLREQIATGTLGHQVSPRTSRADRAWASLWRARPLPVAHRVLLPLAVASSAAAAGVHAAVGPEHFRAGLLFGTFFALTALGQLAWAGAASVHCTRRLLTVGAVGNLAVLTLWLVTRTVGLPGGLLPEPEPFGPWDLACAGWELMVVVTCIGMLRGSHADGRLPAWSDWHLSVRVFVISSVLLLGALSFSGAGA